MNDIDVSKLSEPLLPGSSFNWRSPPIRKVALYIAAIAITAGTLAFILFSPLLLNQLTHTSSIDWTRLSNIGQTYGAASAILSGIALIGISLSLLIQSRQAKAERIRITRERHIELLRIVLDAPDIYGPVIGFQPRPTVDSRQFLFSTMWVNYARIGFQMGVLTEEILHEDVFGPAFRSEPMRSWWIAVRKYWSGNLVQDRKERRFVQIIDEEYRKALMKDPQMMLNVGDSRPNPMTAPVTKRFDMLKGAVLGIAIGIVLRSRLRHNRH
jgi:hypothetical protein